MLIFHNMVQFPSEKYPYSLSLKYKSMCRCYSSPSRVTFFASILFFHYWLNVFCGKVKVLTNQICPVGCSADNPDTDYVEEWRHNTRLLKSNTNAERFWFNSVDR